MGEIKTINKGMCSVYLNGDKPYPNIDAALRDASLARGDVIIVFVDDTGDICPRCGHKEG